MAGERPLAIYSGRSHTETMDHALRKAREFAVGLALGFVPGYLQGARAVDIVALLHRTPVGETVTGFFANGYALFAAFLTTYGIWAFIAASAMKGLLVFFFAPAESVTPAYVLYTAESGVEVGFIVLVAAATITLANTVVYLVALFAGGYLFPDRTGSRWEIMEWLLQEHGKISIFLLRLTPWIGGWAAIPAGVLRMDIRDFLLYSFLGFLLYEGFFGFGAYYGVKLGMVPQLEFLNQVVPRAPG